MHHILTYIYIQHTTFLAINNNNNYYYIYIITKHVIISIYIIYIYTYLHTRICIGVGYWSLSLRSHVISNRRLYVIRVATLIYVKRKLYYSLTVESKCKKQRYPSVFCWGWSCLGYMVSSLSSIKPLQDG